MKGCLKIVGYGFLALLALSVLAVIFSGNTNTRRTTTASTETQRASSQTDTPSQVSGSADAKAPLDAICKTDPKWTEAQTDQYLAGLVGQEIVDWDGWVVEVRKSGGQYELLVAMDPPGSFLWNRDLEISGIPVEQAVLFQKEQPIRFSGKISRVERMFGTNCNPLVVKDATFAGMETASGAEEALSTVTESTAVDATFATICKTDPDWTEVQTEQYLTGLAGQEITDWDGWVYEVRESGGQYELLVAMEPPGGLFWTRDVEISGIPADLAGAFQKEQPIRFSGKISRVERMIGTNCNPLVVKDATFAGMEMAGGAENAPATVTDPSTVEVTFTNICETDPDWTEIQTEQYLAGFAGRVITDWDGWVYEVSEFNGQYKVLVAMEPPGGMFWTRDVEISGIPADLATAFQKEQPIRFSGNISRVERMIGTNCNPIVVKDATFAGMDMASGAENTASTVTDPATVEATFTNICKTDPDWTEIQTGQYLAGFAGREITDWDGWVYEVTEFNGQYKLLVAMEPPGGMFWTRDVEISGIPADMAIALQKEQPIRFSGSISKVERMLGTNCNPLMVKDVVFDAQ